MRTVGCLSIVERTYLVVLDIPENSATKLDALAHERAVVVWLCSVRAVVAMTNYNMCTYLIYLQ